MIGNKLGLLGGLAVAILCFGTQAARATFSIANYSSDPSSGEYQYSVSFVAGSSGTVDAGQGFVIYDFPDLITSGLLNWSLSDLTGFANNLTLSQQTTGNAISPSLDGLMSLEGHTDNPSIENLSFVYNSNTPYSEPSAGATGILTLYTTDLNASLNSIGASGAEDTETGPQNIINTITTPVPEPATLGLLGLTGLALLGGRRRVRKAAV